MGKKSPDMGDEEQSRRFVETAKKLETDESGKSFDRAMVIISPNEGRRSADQDDQTSRSHLRLPDP